MYRCYRKDDAHDPETFHAAVSAILADYSREIILAVTDPRRGLPSKLKWPPMPSEVKEACEAMLGEQQSLQRCLAAFDPGRALPAPPPAPRPTLAEIEAKLARKVADDVGMRSNPIRKHVGDGGHAARVAADLERRRAQREESVTGASTITVRANYQTTGA